MFLWTFAIYLIYYSHQQILQTIICPVPERIARRYAGLSPGSETCFHPSN